MDQGIVLAAVSAAAALGGTWLGSTLSSRNEDHRWLRQERLNAYTALMGAADAYRISASAMWVTDVGSPERVERGTEFYSKFADLDVAADRAKIIGSEATIPVVDAMMAHFVDGIMNLTVREPKPPEAQWTAAANEGYIQHLRAFQGAARADLIINRPRFLEDVRAFGASIWRYLSEP